MTEYRSISPDYLVCENGFVWSYRRTKTKKKLKSFTAKGGYHQVDLYGKRHYVHLLVLEAFVSKRPPGKEACHNNGDTDDNSRDNLRWDTPKNNSKDRELHGTLARGERSATAKLTSSQVRRIRLKVGSHSSIARLFKVSKPRIHYIKTYKSWKHVK